MVQQILMPARYRSQLQITTAGIFDLPRLVDQVDAQNKPFYNNFCHVMRLIINYAYFLK